MPVRKILKQPDVRLRQMADAVTLFDEKLEELFEELEETMRAGPGGVGIAAPQIGESLRMIVVDCRASLRPCKNHGLLLMANPLVEEMDGESLGREGCLSVPDWVGMVPRAKTILVSYDDLHGQRQQIESIGFEARVIQHEVDHLEGVLFTDRVISTKTLVRRL
ncbi:peptide deformylase [Mariprofundus micogutta]|uniref:Peptide deformylase n=1 Tax=Mariprofundus micogutta TaxID=1921010 RepID=A0A1L8CM44_9PROT|nr:peptide deformylase [Mariprofundus micogutta]GAV19982.1 peptide deformylase [Mariprofundus micogutta]